MTTLICIAIVGCAGASVTVRGVSDADFPNGMEAPQLTEGADVTEEFCDWANGHLVSFPSNVANSVFVEQAHNVGRDRTAAADLVSVFLFDESARENLALTFTPDDVRSRPDLSPLSPVISHEGIWLFHRRASSECNSRELTLTSLAGSTLCVEAAPIADPPEDFTRADYRQLTFVLVQGAREQPVEMEVVTLLAAGAVVGRTIPLGRLPDRSMLETAKWCARRTCLPFRLRVLTEKGSTWIADYL